MNGRTVDDLGVSRPGGIGCEIGVQLILKPISRYYSMITPPVAASARR